MKKSRILPLLALLIFTMSTALVSAQTSKEKMETQKVEKAKTTVNGEFKKADVREKDLSKKPVQQANAKVKKEPVRGKAPKQDPHAGHNHAKEIKKAQAKKATAAKATTEQVAKAQADIAAAKEKLKKSKAAKEISESEYTQRMQQLEAAEKAAADIEMKVKKEKNMGTK